MPTVNTIVSNLRYLKLRMQKAFFNMPFRSIVFDVDSNVSFSINGWIYLEGECLNSAKISFSEDKGCIDGFSLKASICPVSYDIQRFLHKRNSNGNLYYIDAMCAYESSFEKSVNLVLDIDNRTIQLGVGKIPANVTKNNVFKFCSIERHKIISQCGAPSTLTFTEKEMESNNKIVDIILPIYNGYEYFESLFESIERTKCKYNLIIVDDCSPDSRVKDFLEQYSQKPEVTLLTNENNLGFVKSVNRGLTESTNDVVLLNSDTELPEGWLERLMMPIWSNDKIASVTPFTNSGTICSFPNFCQNNELLYGLSVEEIDGHFRKLDPKGYIVPTGVGFCMAISRRAIDEIGILDEDNFGKGFGEENDWCQRAINAGFNNVHLNNLFVYHKHGGSFDDEEKSELCQRNSEVLSTLHPDYFTDVDFYILADPAYDDRVLVYNMIEKHPNT